jgi:putative intracellular protease/amidase
MRQLCLLLLSATLLVSCAKDNPKVLLFITDGSRDLELMLTKEVIVMNEMLEQSNFEVVITTLSGETVSVDSVVIEPDLKLGDVNIADYSGFIFPCMAPPWDKIYDLNEEVIEFVKKVSKEGKPMAAQTLSVADFAKAGVLIDKKYAFTSDPDLNEYPEFDGGIYSGEGVIQDGNIITSGTCPWKTREYGKPDGTRRLTQLFINAIKESTK